MDNPGIKKERKIALAATAAAIESPIEMPIANRPHPRCLDVFPSTIRNTWYGHKTLWSDELHACDWVISILEKSFCSPEYVFSKEINSQKTEKNSIFKKNSIFAVWSNLIFHNDYFIKAQKGLNFFQKTQWKIGKLRFLDNRLLGKVKKAQKKPDYLVKISCTIL